MKIRKLDIIVYPTFIVIMLNAILTGFTEGFNDGFNGRPSDPLPVFSTSDYFYLGLNVVLIVIGIIMYIKQKD